MVYLVSRIIGEENVNQDAKPSEKAIGQSLENTLNGNSAADFCQTAKLNLKQGLI